MLRRVAQASRIGLFILGVLLTAWLPLSFVRGVFVTHGSDLGQSFVTSSRGEIQIVFWGNVNIGFDVHLIEPDGGPMGRQESAVWPHYSKTKYRRETIANDVYIVGVPLWLVAFLCLAWPVTSLLLARRTRKARGFAVEAGAAGQRTGTDPPPRRPNNIPPP